MTNPIIRRDTIKYGQFGTQNKPGTGAGGRNPNAAAGIAGMMLAMSARAERQRLGREPTSKELLTRAGYKFTNKTTPGGPINPGVYDATLAMYRGEGTPTKKSTPAAKATKSVAAPAGAVATKSIARNRRRAKVDEELPTRSLGEAPGRGLMARTNIGTSLLR
jgi:hypothetical protein